MVSQKDFREAMASLAAAVNVITTDGPAGCHGMTATAVCSVSDDPATLLLCVNKQARMHEVLLANGRFCVNVLAAGQGDISAAFAARGMTIEERLAAAGGVMLADCGLPALTQAQLSLACRVAQNIDAGTHTIFFGQVEQILKGFGAGALVYFNRDYHHLAH
jgi:flavin reductase